MQPLDAEVAGAARVLGYTLSPAALHPGDVLEVTVYWSPPTRTALPYTVFIHLFDPAAGSLAQRDTYPGGGNWATTVWDPGRPFVETYRLHLPSAAAPGSGYILLGLYERNSGERLPLHGADAVPAEGWIEFGQVTWAP